MKIKSLFCACNGRTDNPLNHYERDGGCTQLPAPRPWMRALLANQQGGSGVPKVKGALSPSRLLGCPRESIILDGYGPPGKGEGVEGVNLMGGNSMLWGTAIHEYMEKHAAPGECVEVTIPPEGVAPPVVCGVPLRGRIDDLSPDYSEMIDYKMHGEFGMKSRLGEVDTQVQLSLYSHMVARLPNGRYPDTQGAWHGSMATSVEPWRLANSDLLSEDEILDHKPKNGIFTVADIIEEYKTHEADIDLGVAPEVAAGRMKLVGRTMMNMKKCPKYCAALEICDALEARWPQED